MRKVDHARGDPVRILAPHPDDEIIGCFHFIECTDRPVFVHYFFELSEQRRIEAQRAGEALGFYTEFHPNADLDHLSFAGLDYVIPAITDEHPHHEALNRRYRESAKLYYSVDMVNKKPLPPEVALRKMEFLNNYYPSQRTLWDRDNKYFLFEDVSESDVEQVVSVQLANLCLRAKGTELEVGEFLIANRHLAAQRILDRAISKFGKPLELEIGNTHFKC